MAEIDLNSQLLSWARELPNWKRDALRRIAVSKALTDEDVSEVKTLMLQTDEQPGTGVLRAVPLEETHLPGGGGAPPIVLKSIDEIRHVNRLAPDARLDFGTKETERLTVVYGENGSGKSGFTRILRRCCRTRIDDRGETEILGNVAAEEDGDPTARVTIIREDGSPDPLVWTDSEGARPELRGISVYDAEAARIYVADGQRIEIEPFPIAAMRTLIGVCDRLRGLFDSEINEKTTSLTPLRIDPAPDAETGAAAFLSKLNGQTTDTEIDHAARFSEADEERRKFLDEMLIGSASEIRRLRDLASWVEGRLGEMESLSNGLEQERIGEVQKLKRNLENAQTAAAAGAAERFKDDLPGTGGEVWRQLYEAAKKYSVDVAYQGQPFPFVETGALCVWCQQPLAEGRDRLRRFEEWMAGETQKAADAAALAFKAAWETFEKFPEAKPSEFDAWVERVREYNDNVADKLQSFWAGTLARLEALKKAIAGDQKQKIPDMPESLGDALKNLVQTLRSNANAGEEALSMEGNEAMLKEFNELNSRKLLHTQKVKLVAARDIKAEIAALGKARDAAGTTGITRKANDLAQSAITEQVQTRFKDECTELLLTPDRLGLNLATGQRRQRDMSLFVNEFDGGRAAPLQKVLSEGENRALSLAAFLSETSVVAPGSPLVIDDPVSSLDHVRSAAVAKRLAKESQRRQVIVFTHNLEFFNNLLTEATALGGDPKGVAVFRAGAEGTGRLNPLGGPWKSQPVTKRIGYLRNKLQEIKGNWRIDPTIYETDARGIYTLLRETYERFVEENLFNQVIARFRPDVQTMRLREVAVTNELVSDFHAKYDKACHYSHDNAATSSVSPPEPEEVSRDIAALEELLGKLRVAQDQARAARPAMTVPKR